MTDTFGDLVNSIANASRRFSMSAEIINCIYSAIEEYEPRRFWFNELSDTFSISASQTEYTSADASFIPRIMEIDELAIFISASDIPALRKGSLNEFIEANNPTATSRPAQYAYNGQSIWIDPTPDQAYLAAVYGVLQLPSLSVSTDSNAWTQRGNGKELIKQNALARLYSEYLRDDMNATRAQAREMRALARLESRTTSLQASSEITPCL